MGPPSAAAIGAEEEIEDRGTQEEHRAAAEVHT